MKFQNALLALVSYHYGNRVIVVLYCAIQVNKMFCFMFCFVAVAHNVHTACSQPFSVCGRLLIFWVAQTLKPGVETSPVTTASAAETAQIFQSFLIIIGQL